MTDTRTISRRTRTTAALLALGVSALAACGGTTQSAGGSVPPPTIGIGVTAPATGPDTVSPTAPGPAPAPAPAPAPTTTPPPTPAPVPEPVEVPLLGALVWEVTGTRDDGAGGSTETRRVGSDGVGLRAYAWHGYNGSGEARATATTAFDASQYLGADVPVARVEVRFAASGYGALQAPWDRSARIWVDARSTGTFPEGPALHTFIDQSIAGIYERIFYSFNEGGAHSFLVTPENPRVTFVFDAICLAAGGPMATGLFSEGYCDFFEQGSDFLEPGSLTLDSLSVVVTPLPQYDIVDGVPVG